MKRVFFVLLVFLFNIILLGGIWWTVIESNVANVDNLFGRGYIIISALLVSFIVENTMIKWVAKVLELPTI